MSGLLEKYLQQAGSDVGDAMAFGNYLPDDLFYLATSPEQADAAAFILISAAANIAVQLTVIHGMNTTDGVQKQLGVDIHFLMEGMLS